MKKILIISASGMGCTIMFTPALRAIRNHFPDAHITFLGTNRSFVAPVVNCSFVDDIQVFDFAKDSLFKINRLGPRLKSIRNLRRQNFTASLTVFPSNKWYFNVFAWLVGAKKRITHRYQTADLGNLGFLQNIRIPADEKLHDVEQNLNLLKGLGIDPTTILNKDLFFHVPERDRGLAGDFLKYNRIPGKKLVGMHIGSSDDFAFVAKRWPTEKFAALADKIQDELNAQVLIFAGPSETEEVSKLRDLMKTKSHIVQQPLAVTAALIKECDLMVSNDSGLMHIAVAMRTPVVAIFGPTNITRTKPYTNKATVVTDPSCNSLLKYPFTSTSAKLDPEKSKRCFVKITVPKVFAAVTKSLDA